MISKRTLINLIIAVSVLANISLPFTFAQEPFQTAPIAALSMTSCEVTEPVRAEPLKDPNADRFGFGPWYINADRTIWAGWDVGKWVSGEKGNKVLWIRPQGTQLKISGRQLEGDAAPLEARIPCCYPTGFQSTRLIFPTAGCWQVTATAGNSTLTFVANVR